MSANATARQLAAITEFGRSLGLAFQVIDDILDVTQTSEKLGKSAGKDIAAKKATYPAVIGLEKSRARSAGGSRSERMTALKRVWTQRPTSCARWRLTFSARILNRATPARDSDRFRPRRSRQSPLQNAAPRQTQSSLRYRCRVRGGAANSVRLCRRHVRICSRSSRCN